MAACSRSSGSDQPSIKYMWTKPGAASLELSDFDQEGNVSKLSGSYRQHSKLSEPKTSEILSTAEFVSAVGRLWNWANRPLSVFQPKTNAKYTDYGYQKQNILCYSGAEANGKASISADTKCFCTDVMDDSYFPQVVNSEFECLKVTQKISLFDPCNGHRSHLSFGRYLQTSDSQLPVQSWKGKGLISVGISYNLGEIYGWIRQIPFLGPKSSVNAIHSKNNKEDQGCISGISGGTVTPVGIFTRESSDYSTCVTKHENSLLVENAASEHHAQMPVNSLYSDYHFDLVSNIEANSVVPRTSSSNLYLDYHTDLPSLSNCIFEECKHTSDDEEMLKNGKRQVKELVLEHGHTTELFSSVQNKSGFSLGKKRHAFAGALAGTCVSLCLHPVDTVKTVIQSRYMYEKSIGHIVRSIISERGVTGFYRGIASNIACSAPISAVYTFTYESVKGALLPILPKEYYSIAHCTAGGCASIATSFIFTPSERIKQQMQIGSHYQSCWSALVGILERGGLRSLYAGWGAVLCRNIPHSIIKFYTYESLKQLFSSSDSNAHPATFQTLICGGLAGSTAAFFTTPFDVVKTRLQTQIPGSSRQYDGVFCTLKEIARHEGFRGLYRGLTPRLVMYISQGAIFFASYEFFKSILTLEIRQLRAETIRNEQNLDNELTSPSLHS